MARVILERDHELAVLTAAVEEAAAGAGSVVLVCGKAGIGSAATTPCSTCWAWPRARSGCTGCRWPGCRPGRSAS